MKSIGRFAALVLCFLLLLPAGCSQPAEPEIELPEPSFDTGEPHSNAVAFRLWFETMSSTAGPCTVSVQDKIYDEEQAEEWWYAIQSDLNTLNQALGLEEDSYTPFTVFIVENALHGIQVWNDWLYCTPEDILSGAYREGLIGAAFSAVPWKQIGIADSVFGTEEADAGPLAAYLADAEDAGLLGLYAPYFSDAFAGEDEIALARTAARLLCEHAAAVHGGAMLVKDPCIGCRQELLDELGVDRTYTDLFGDFDSGFNYRSSSDFPMIVTNPRGDMFYITPLPEKMEKASGVCSFLYEACVGPQAVLDAVKADAPEYAERLEQNYSHSFTCVLDPQIYAQEKDFSSITYFSTRNIALGAPWDIIHEISHLLVPTIGVEDWKYEACCEYFRYKYYPGVFQTGYYSYYFSEDRFTREDYETEEAFLIDQKAVELYLAHAAYPQSAEELDFMLFYRSMLAACCLVVPDWEQQSVFDLYQTPGTSVIGPRGGNALSYWEAAIFADYLIENYSLSSYLNYCFDVDATFAEAFGVDYETAHAAWLEELLNM